MWYVNLPRTPSLKGSFLGTIYPCIMKSFFTVSCIFHSPFHPLGSTRRSPADNLRSPLPSWLITEALPYRMWQNSAAVVRSAVKLPSEHSHIPIFVMSSSDAQRICDASTCQGVLVVGFGAKSLSSMFPNFSNVFNCIIFLPKVANCGFMYK